jgi:hypothetical protein
MENTGCAVPGTATDLEMSGCAKMINVFIYNASLILFTDLCLNCANLGCCQPI